MPVDSEIASARKMVPSGNIAFRTHIGIALALQTSRGATATAKQVVYIVVTGKILATWALIAEGFKIIFSCL
jgi:hypothetical protein